jgi:hypothetical protein
MRKKFHDMKKLFTLALVAIAVSATTLLTGCLGLSIGGGTTSKPATPTVGQQLIDLQTAKNAGAITETEYQAQKTKILNNR